MIYHGPAFTDFAHAPQVQPRTVDEGETGNDGESPSGRKGEVVAKVEKGGGDGTEKDGKFEPGEKGALGCELDFGLDADRDVDS